MHRPSRLQLCVEVAAALKPITLCTMGYLWGFVTGECTVWVQHLGLAVSNVSGHGRPFEQPGLAEARSVSALLTGTRQGSNKLNWAMT